MPTTPRVIVAHMGARHGYAVPRILHQRGALSRLYTDLSAKGVVASAAAAWPMRFDLPVVGKLRRRTVKGIPPSMVYSAPMVNMRSALATGKTQQERYAIENRLFGAQMQRWGVGDANIVYGMYGSGVPFWRHAKSQGLKIVVDMFITPLHHRIMVEESRRNPGWDDQVQLSEDDCLLIDRTIAEMIDVADLLLCPSSTVVQGLASMAKTLPTRIAVLPRAVVVPYGAELRSQLPAKPVPGHVLFAGGVELRKGIPYLAKAAEIASQSDVRTQYRVAGQAGEKLRAHPDARHLTFLGHLSREALISEYLSADVFALPTLAEGSAGVVFEAMAAGIPVVTTHSAGSVITHGKEGLIVPERDGLAVARAVEKIVKDRALRDAMSREALKTASANDECQWGDRLFNVLASL